MEPMGDERLFVRVRKVRLGYRASIWKEPGDSLDNCVKPDGEFDNDLWGFTYESVLLKADDWIQQYRNPQESTDTWVIKEDALRARADAIRRVNMYP
jgi:hypothetical protein